MDTDNRTKPQQQQQQQQQLKPSSSSSSSRVLTYSVSANTGRITVHHPTSSSPVLQQVNFSIEEFQDYLLSASSSSSSAQQQQGSSNNHHAVFESLLHHMMPNHHPPEVVLMELKSFVEQWTNLKAYEKKVLADGRMLRLPLTSYIQQIDDMKRAKAPCFQRYLPPSSSSSSSTVQENTSKKKRRTSSGGLHSQGSSAQSPRPLLPLPPSAVQRKVSPTSWECAWCAQSITEKNLLQNLVAQQAALSSRHIYCSFECGNEVAIRAGNAPIIRRQLFALEHGICQLCGLDAQALYQQVKSLTPPERVQLFMNKNLSGFPEAARLDPKEGMFWQADHVLPVAEGGGSAGLDNFRTLCTPCHALETAKLRTRLKAHKAKLAAIGTKDIRSCFTSSSSWSGGEGRGGRGEGGEETSPQQQPSY